MKVTLREKKIKHSKRSLYLDFYPAIVANGRNTRREFLSLYIFEKPKTELERDHNKETRLLAESIRSKRQLDLQANPHGFISPRRKNADFLTFFRNIIEQKQKLSKSTIATWTCVYSHFVDFCGGSCSFKQIDSVFVERFRNYLLTCESHKTLASELKKTILSPNTAKSYFEHFTTAVKQAREANYLSADPTAKVDSIKGRTPEREFLLIDELQKLARTECNIPENLRRAALFSALTGLRYSDLVNLTWANLRHNASSGNVLNIRVQKTGETQTIPISDEARDLLGKRGDPSGQIFKDLKRDSRISLFIERWTKAAGINRRITFHSFRRTFATAQITLGTDIYTVSKMLGHQDIKMTQIYAHLVDEKKREAANKITLK